MLEKLILATLCVVVLGESVHWQWREMTCQSKEDQKSAKETENKEAANCVLTLRETEFDTNGRRASSTGCFDEVNNGTTRTYCNIGCPKADTVYMIKRTPYNHKSCFTQFTYRVERRGQEWFLWRDKKCRTSQVEFTIRCEFLFARADFPSDEVIFSRLSKPVAKAMALK